jgi:hypothetical protein
MSVVVKKPMLEEEEESKFTSALSKLGCCLNFFNNLNFGLMGLRDSVACRGVRDLEKGGGITGALVSGRVEGEDSFRGFSRSELGGEARGKAGPIRGGLSLVRMLLPLFLADKFERDW